MMDDFLRPLDLGDLDLIRAWRNSERVRCVSFSTDIIDDQAHSAWFAKISADPDREAWIAVDGDGHPFGFVQFSGHLADGIVEWGFYVDATAGRGLGKRLASLALAYAFGKRSWHRVEGRVRATNEASQGFHLRLGFEQEGRLRQKHITTDGYEDVLIFGILSNDWKVSLGETL